MSVTFMEGTQKIYAGNRKKTWLTRLVIGPQATNLFLVVEPLFVAVSACDWYPMITFGGTPNLSLYTRLKMKNKHVLHVTKQEKNSLTLQMWQ